MPSGSRDCNNHLLWAMTTTSGEEIRSHLKPVLLRKGAVLAEPGDAVEHVYFPESGIISLMIATACGKNIEANLVGREGAVGLQGCLGIQSCFYLAVAQTDCRVLMIASSQLERLFCGSPAMRDITIRYTELLWAESQQLAACNAIHGAPNRVCRRLAQIAERTDDSSLPITHELIAEAIGVQRTTVTLLLRTLQQAGIVQITRGQVQVLDLQGVHNRACECCHILRSKALMRFMGIKL